MKGLLELVTRVNFGKAADRPFSKLHSHSVSHSVIHHSHTVSHTVSRSVIHHSHTVSHSVSRSVIHHSNTVSRSVIHQSNKR
jgi:hypothetical protein